MSHLLCAIWRYCGVGMLAWLGLLFVGQGTLAAAVDCTTHEAIAVYTQGEEARYSVFLSTRNDGVWQEPIKLSENTFFNIVPAVAVNAEKDIWVVWAVFNQGETSLYMKRYEKGSWTEEEKIETGMTSSIAPSLLFDDDNVLWLVWAGDDGQDDDIYYSRWNGAHFEPPARVTDNMVPDVQPVLGLTEDGVPWVQWQFYDGEKYSVRSAIWNDRQSEWLMQTEGESEPPLQKAIRVQAADTKGPVEGTAIELPDFIQHPQTSSLHIPGESVQSIPYRMLQPYLDEKVER